MADLPSIQFKRTSSEGKLPIDSDLALGEIAVNPASYYLVTKDSDKNINKIGFGNVGNDSDTSYVLDENAKQISKGITEANITVITDSDNDSWQTTQEMIDLRVGAKVTVFRKTKVGGDGFTV